MTVPKLSFRPVWDERTEGYLPWVRELSGLCGVYVIRAEGVFAELVRMTGLSDGILYVGESHRGHLKRTFVRHFQEWDEWRGGATYERTDISAAVIVTKPDEARDLEGRLIDLLEPRDNAPRTNPDDDDEDTFAPF